MGILVHAREFPAHIATGEAGMRWVNGMMLRDTTRAEELAILADVLAELGRQACGYYVEVDYDARDAYVFATPPDPAPPAGSLEAQLWNCWLEHGLTVAECVGNVATLIGHVSKYTIRWERHPQNPDTPGGFAEDDPTQEQLAAEAEADD